MHWGTFNIPGPGPFKSMSVPCHGDNLKFLHISTGLLGVAVVEK